MVKSSLIPSRLQLTGCGSAQGHRHIKRACKSLWCDKFLRFSIKALASRRRAHLDRAILTSRRCMSRLHHRDDDLRLHGSDCSGTARSQTRTLVRYVPSPLRRASFVGRLWRVVVLLGCSLGALRSEAETHANDIFCREQIKARRRWREELDKHHQRCCDCSPSPERINWVPWSECSCGRRATAQTVVHHLESG